jgi:hypothetical protein
MRTQFFLYIVFIFLTAILSMHSAFAMDEEEAQEKGLVEVEPNNILPSDVASSYVLVPYQLRRARWGHLFTIGYSQFHPYKYESDYISPGLSDFDSLYGSAPMFEISYTYKYNFKLGSIGGEIGYGHYSNAADDTVAIQNANLSVQIVRLGVRYSMDNLFSEPYIVPYGILGAYTALYHETQGNRSFNGTTGASEYWGAGALFQLNKADRAAAVEAYTESGIENTFLFVEARQYLASTVEKDPDFSTKLDINFGMNLEF